MKTVEKEGFKVFVKLGKDPRDRKGVFYDVVDYSETDKWVRPPDDARWGALACFSTAKGAREFIPRNMTTFEVWSVKYLPAKIREGLSAPANNGSGETIHSPITYDDTVLADAVMLQKCLYVVTGNNVKKSEN